MPDLALIWGLLIAFAVFAYVVLDGFDLGIGILFMTRKADADREVMINAIAPVWDGNETWLVLGGGGLMAAFPLAFAIIMPAFYAPLIAMLLGLVFRGVAFEFRFRTVRWRPLWDLGFVAGSTVAAFAQGIMVGAFVQGIAVAGRAYAGGWFDWFTPFSVMTGLALVAGYALLGAAWLILKTTGPLQEAMYGAARRLAAAVTVFLVVVSVWTPLIDPGIASRWFAWPNTALLAPVPLMTALAVLALFRALAERREYSPFILALVVFLFTFFGLGISLYPFAVPYAVTFEQAAAPDASLAFLLVGALVLLPIILAYTGYAYWIFRGKVDPEAGYH